jgi:O-antigen ligase
LAIFLGVLIIAGAQSTSRFKIDRLGSDYERISQWKTAILAFNERPFLGMGYLNFEKMCPSLKVKYNVDQKQFCGHAHNNFLEMLASTGVVGLLSFVVWLFLWFIELVRKNNFQAQLLIPLFVVALVSGLTQSTFTLGANLFLIIGLYVFSLLEVKGKG